MNTLAATTLEIRRPSPQVAEVWLNRPEVRNAFNDAAIADLTHVFRAFAQDAALRAVVLAGHGKAFCAGADLNWMRAMAGYSWEENRADAEKLADMLWAIWSCPVRFQPGVSCPEREPWWSETQSPHRAARQFR